MYAPELKGNSDEMKFGCRIEAGKSEVSIKPQGESSSPGALYLNTDCAYHFRLRNGKNDSVSLLCLMRIVMVLTRDTPRSSNWQSTSTTTL